jgi:hypothetical protein
MMGYMTLHDKHENPNKFAAIRKQTDRIGKLNPFRSGDVLDERHDDLVGCFIHASVCDQSRHGDFVALLDDAPALKRSREKELRRPPPKKVGISTIYEQERGWNHVTL